MKKYKQYLLPVLVVVFFVLGLFAVSLSVKQRQTLRNKAANTSGIGSVSLVPVTATHNIGDLFPVTLKFNTGGASISSIALRLIYRFTGATPELDATSITADNALLSTGDWTFPVKTITKSNGMVTIDFSGVNTNTAGYSSTTDTNLATINFRVNSLPSINPVILSFDATQSKMITKSGFKDILGQPNSGSYTIVSPTPTP